MFFGLLKIQGHSMEPTIPHNSTVLVSSILNIFQNPKKGTVVAFKKSNKIFIKRVKDAKNNRYFFVGDNQKDSLDSRKIGWISKKDILGRVLYVF
jgi:nickel-type superoxide dismutase maturation protease